MPCRSRPRRIQFPDPWYHVMDGADSMKRPSQSRTLAGSRLIQTSATAQGTALDGSIAAVRWRSLFRKLKDCEQQSLGEPSGGYQATQERGGDEPSLATPPLSSLFWAGIYVSLPMLVQNFYEILVSRHTLTKLHSRVRAPCKALVDVEQLGHSMSSGIAVY